LKKKYPCSWRLKIEYGGSFYYDIDNKKLYVWLADNSDPNEHIIEASVRPFFFHLIGVDYIKISGFKMMHSNISALFNWPALIIGGSYCIVENVDVEWCDCIGCTIGGNCNTVINSKFNWCGNSGLNGTGWGNRVINCEMKYNNWREWDIGWHAGGVKIIPYAHDWVFSGCEVAYNYGFGIWFDTWMSNVTIQNNISHHNSECGIFYEIGTRGIIKNNICYENGGRGIWVQNSSDTLVAHNLCYRNGKSGIVIIGDSRKGGIYGREEDEVLLVKNNVVWGNILIDNCFPGLAPKGWETRPELVLPDKRETNFNNFSDYNIFIRRDGRRIIFWGGWDAEPLELLEWQAKTGNDKHSIVINYPTIDLFLDIDHYDFRPVKGAICINFVKPIMDVRYDITGFDRVYGGLQEGKKRTKFTAGPYEWREGL
jgi:parallel beta-helix repeat protein